MDYAKAFDSVDHNKLLEILKEMGIPDHQTCLLWHQYAGQETTVRSGHGTTDWFQIVKGVCQAVYCHPAYLTYIQSTSWEMLARMKHKLESRLLGKISITSDIILHWYPVAYWAPINLGNSSFRVIPLCLILFMVRYQPNKQGWVGKKIHYLFFFLRLLRNI